MRQTDSRGWVRTTYTRVGYTSSSDSSSDDEEVTSLRQQLANQTLELEKLKAFKAAADAKAAEEAKAAADAKAAEDAKAAAEGNAAADA
jgi:hypothetical protein